MKTKITLFTLVCIFISQAYFAQVIWSGTKLTFTKADGADWTLAVNQDRITPNVWITRANNKGIFNIKTEVDYTDFVSPDDTEWAFGTTANLSNLTFDSWENTNGSSPPSIVGQDMVLHLISENIYIDIKFLSWASGGQGGQGGFSYERSTNNLDVEENVAVPSLTVYPNPAGDFIDLNLNEPAKLIIRDVKGSDVFAVDYEPGQHVDISSLKKGTYFLVDEEGSTTRFIKE